MHNRRGNNMSFYGKYIHEHRGDEIIENEYGFATFRYLDDETVYIVDLYIDSDFRQSKHASAIADKVVETARVRGCTKLLGTVTPSAKNSTTSLKVLLGYGMILKSSSNDLIIFEKEI
jgi:GNAT superfamily N-acetyltransferase